MQRNYIERKARRGAANRVLIMAILGCAFPALLPAAQPPTERVKISDLDLSTTKGQRVLEHRLKVAVERVCVRPNSQLPRTQSVEQHIENCRTTALTGAQQQLQAQGIQVMRAARRN